MSNYPTLRPVTRVRIAMESSPSLREALSAFPHHEGDESFPLYTTAQRVMYYREYHEAGESRQRNKVQEANKLLVPELAQRAILLASPSELFQNAAGSVLRVYFDADRPEQLEELTNVMKDVDTVEPLSGINKLYAELAIGGLTNARAFGRARESLDAVLGSAYTSRHTQSAFATNAELQIEHIPRYPLR